jgi:adenylyl-sulfate kinase
MVKKSAFTVWFTGLPGSGKTTLANMVGQELLGRGIDVEILDGDTIRTHLSKGLGFSKEDRDTNIRRIGWVCQQLTKHGVPSITAAVSPYREVRDEVRQLIEAVGGPGSFIEVFLNCPLEVCEQRDPKGLYKRARLGEIANFTGISDPYEPPEKPELILDTASEYPGESTKKVLAALRMRGWVR